MRSMLEILSTVYADSPLEGAINSLSVAVTNFQPLNDGKKWLAKVQAGDYPEGQISAKLDQYIQNNPVEPPLFLHLGAPMHAVRPDTLAHIQCERSGVPLWHPATHP